MHAQQALEKTGINVLYESNNSEFLIQKATPCFTDRGRWRDINRDLGVDVDVDQDRQRQRL